MSRVKNIVRQNDLPWHDNLRGDRLTSRRRRLGRAAGGVKLGASLYELPAGGQLWTYHYHHANEEAMLVLEGQGSVRLPNGRQPIVAGDYLAFPTGPEGAHMILADAGVSLRLLAMSTLDEADVVSHPDSGKIGAFSRHPLKTSAGKPVRGMFLHTDNPVPVWSGEEEPE